MNFLFSISEWSVIYVGIFISFLLAGSICAVVFLSCKKGQKSQTGTNGRTARSRKRYTRLEQNENNFELRSKYFFYRLILMRSIKYLINEAKIVLTSLILYQITGFYGSPICDKNTMYRKVTNSSTVYY